MSSWDHGGSGEDRVALPPLLRANPHTTTLPLGPSARRRPFPGTHALPAARQRRPAARHPGAPSPRAPSVTLRSSCAASVTASVASRRKPAPPWRAAWGGEAAAAERDSRQLGPPCAPLERPALRHRVPRPVVSCNREEPRGICMTAPLALRETLPASAPPVAAIFQATPVSTPHTSASLRAPFGRPPPSLARHAKPVALPQVPGVRRRAVPRHRGVASAPGTSSAFSVPPSLARQ